MSTLAINSGLFTQSKGKIQNYLQICIIDEICIKRIEFVVPILESTNYKLQTWCKVPNVPIRNVRPGVSGSVHYRYILRGVL